MLISVVHIFFAQKLHLEVSIIEDIGVLGPARLGTLHVGTMETDCLRSTNKSDEVLRGQIHSRELSDLKRVEVGFRNMLDNV